VVDDLTPEFCLKMGHKFVASSKSEASGGVSAELRSRGGSGSSEETGSSSGSSSLNQILLNIMDAEKS